MKRKTSEEKHPAIRVIRGLKFPVLEGPGISTDCYTVAPDVDTIAVPNFALDLLDHSYFAQAEALLHDIFDVMRLDAAPGQRQRITPTVHEGATLWKLGK